MMGIGFTEMVLIAGLALVVIGPEKFPDFAKLVIRTIRDLRGYVDEVKHEVSKELKPIKKEMDELSRIDPEKYIDSLTSEAPPKKNTTAAPVHEADKKVMDEAATYGDDPYGWQEGEESDYRADKGAYPEDSAGFEHASGQEAAADTAADKDAFLEETIAYGQAEAQTPASSEAPAPSPEEAPAPDPPEDPEFDAFKEIHPRDGDGESDVWTGR